MGGPTSGNPKGGPGRNPLPPGVKRIKTSITIKPCCKNWLDRQQVSISRTIEKLIEEKQGVKE